MVLGYEQETVSMSNVRKELHSHLDQLRHPGNLNRLYNSHRLALLLDQVRVTWPSAQSRKRSTKHNFSSYTIINRERLKVGRLIKGLYFRDSARLFVFTFEVILGMCVFTSSLINTYFQQFRLKLCHRCRYTCFLDRFR